MHILKTTEAAEVYYSTELDVKLKTEIMQIRKTEYGFDRNAKPFIKIPCAYGLHLSLLEEPPNMDARVRTMTNTVLDYNPLKGEIKASFEDALFLSRTGEFRYLVETFGYIEDVEFYELASVPSSLLIGFVGRSLRGYHSMQFIIYDYVKKDKASILNYNGELNPYSEYTTEESVQDIGFTVLP